MNQPIPESQLVLNSEGAVYHLNLHPDQLADDVLLVGDPGRVELIASFFDKIEVKRQNRELVTRTGYYNGKRITVMSTGMGTDNLDIVMNELDALANIDLKTRIPKEGHRSLNLIRIGTCGALQPEIEVEDSYVATRYAIGLDGLLYFYAKNKEVNDIAMRDAFIKQMDYPKDLPLPYVVECSKDLFDRLAQGYYQGLTATAPGFYGPQGRTLRMDLAYPEHNRKIESFNYQGWRVCNFEMESSALYGLGKMMGHNCLTICVAIANRVTEKFASDYHPYVKKLVINTLERLSSKP
ncbi:MAG: nucleoside phosphorylase [Bacteroidales bacterium]|nr:nucleoside phosphorylase [Bacteroidales bacterium]MBR6847922.1 nucleoside phosphorylase [Bacteroidales bacterium]